MYSMCVRERCERAANGDDDVEKVTKGASKERLNKAHNNEERRRWVSEGEKKNVNMKQNQKRIEVTQAINRNL